MERLEFCTLKMTYKNLIVSDVHREIQEDTLLIGMNEIKENPRIVFNLRKNFFEEACVCTNDLSLMYYTEFWKLLLLFLNASRKLLKDTKGRVEEVNWLNFWVRDLKKILYEMVVSPTILMINSFKIFYLLNFVCARGKTISNLEKVLYFRTDLTSAVGGSIAHTYGVVKSFMDMGVELKFVSPNEFPLQEKLKCEKILIKPSGKIRNFKEVAEMLYNHELFYKLKTIFKGRNLDLIYQRYSRNNYTGVLLSLKYGIPLIIEYNGSEVWVSRNWGKRLIFEKITDKIEMLNLRLADMVVVVSNILKEELLARGIEGTKIFVNPNGVDPKMYNPGIKGEKIRGRYEFGDTIVVGFIGTFGHWHGVEVLAMAGKSLLQKDSNIRFLLIGDGVKMPKVKRIFKEDGTEEFVVLTGIVPQEEAPPYLAASDILVSPHLSNPDGSRFFGSPIKLFEYMAMGKAIVASDLEQIGEVLKNNQTALLVKPGDPQALAEAIARLASDYELRVKLGKAAREEVLAKYTWEQHVGRIIKALEKVCGSKEVHAKARDIQGLFS